MKNNRQTLMPLLWIMLFDQISLSLIFPVLTLVFFDTQSALFSPEASHAERSMWYGICLAMPHILNIIMAPVLGALSDEFGRKKILLVCTLGALFFSLTSALGILYGSLFLFLIGLAIQGLFSRTNPVAQAVIGDVSPPTKKVVFMGYLQFAISIGAFIGPVIGGYFANRFFFATLNFSLSFFIAAVIAGISFLLAIFIFKETLQTKRQHLGWQVFHFSAITNVLSNPNVLRISLILLLTQISWSIYYQFIPPILKVELGFNSHHLGLFIGLIAFWLALATSIGIKALDAFFTSRQTLLIALYLVLIGTLLSFVFCFLHLSGNWSLLIWISAIPTAAGDVIAYSCLTALYSDAVEQQEQGKVMGICFIVVAIIWTLTGLLGGMMMSIYSLLPLIIAPIGILWALGLLHSQFGKNLSGKEFLQ